MDITLNGEARQVTNGLTIAGLLANEGLTQRRVAIEVNGEIVPLGRHSDYLLRQGDRLEIVHALGGG